MPFAPFLNPPKKLSNEKRFDEKILNNLKNVQIKKEEVINYPGLEIVRIEQLITKGASGNRLLSCQFADKVREMLLAGEAKIVKNSEN